jgi:hypothetical protein
MSSIFVDRDGEYFGHVLEYMRDGVVSVAKLEARPSVSLLRALKREFGFYCIELSAEVPREPEMLETVFVLGGRNRGADALSIMEQYDTSSGQWSAAPAMNTARSLFAACVLQEKSTRLVVVTMFLLATVVSRVLRSFLRLVKLGALLPLCR